MYLCSYLQHIFIYLHYENLSIQNVMQQIALCVFECRNFLTLQQSPATKQWQEKPLCLGNTGSCRGFFSGPVLGFGEDELGKQMLLNHKPYQ